jgi:tRNA(fMet)-specific endonuclease VapC
MYVLDSDYLSLIAREESQPGKHLRQRITAVGLSEFATTVANYEEQTRGWLAFTAKARQVSALIDAYDRLQRHLDLYCSIQVLGFDDVAATKFQALKNSKLGIGTMDLRIASIVLSHDATLLSRNLVDFHRVPGLKVEDWLSKFAG